jgi:DNA (cytosine-5)-methyltransferase 1
MRLLDLYCGAGGASKGYHDAGFEVVGVDLHPMPRYPYEFFQDSALNVLDTLIRGGKLGSYSLDDFDAIHASPPCQAYSSATADYRLNRGGSYPDLVEPTRSRLIQTGKPWVIENVPGAPVRADFKLCGCFFGLKHLRRVRLFETSWWAGEPAPTTEHRHELPALSICGSSPPSCCRRKWREAYGRNVTEQDRQQAMGGMDWMKPRELSESIPAVYSEYVGTRLASYIALRARYALAA